MDAAKACDPRLVNFRCVFCGQGGMNWILSTHGHVICDSCGMKQPPPLPLSEREQIARNEDDLRQRLERRVKALEDMASHYHHFPVGDPSVGNLFERVTELENWRSRQTKRRQR